MCAHNERPQHKVQRIDVGGQCCCRCHLSHWGSSFEWNQAGMIQTWSTGWSSQCLSLRVVSEATGNQAADGHRETTTHTKTHKSWKRGHMVCVLYTLVPIFSVCSHTYSTASFYCITHFAGYIWLSQFISISNKTLVCPDMLITPIIPDFFIQHIHKSPLAKMSYQRWPLRCSSLLDDWASQCSWGTVAVAQV